MQIVRTVNRNEYEGLRSLWHEVFGDEPEYVDAMYEALDADGFAVTDDEGRVVSALTLYRAGYMHIPEAASHTDGQTEDGGDSMTAISDADTLMLHGLPVYVSYAICTDPAYRGLGLAGALTGYVRDIVTAPRGAVIPASGQAACECAESALNLEAPQAEGLGGISLVSPAEESLIGFYAQLGYREGFCVTEMTADESSPEDQGSDESEPDNAVVWGIDQDGRAGFLDDAADCGSGCSNLSLRFTDCRTYNDYRENFLKDVPHVALESRLLDFIREDSGEGGGMAVINGGDAICRIAYSPEAGAMIDDLIVNPALKALSQEIDEEIAMQLSSYLGADRILYRTPGEGRCQSMYASGLQDGAQKASEESEAVFRGYFGFPLD